jgi:integrase/recombinase XerD
VTHLRQIMLEELRRRNYPESTIHTYIHTIEHFSKYFHRRPDELGPEQIRQYQPALFTRWKLAPNTVTQRLAAVIETASPTSLSIDSRAPPYGSYDGRSRE